MFLRNNRHKLIFQKRNSTDRIGNRLGLDHADINMIVQDMLLYGGRLVDDCFHAYIREYFLKRFHQSRQDMGSNGNTGTDPDRPKLISVFQFLFHCLK